MNDQETQSKDNYFQQIAEIANEMSTAHGRDFATANTEFQRAGAERPGVRSGWADCCPASRRPSPTARPG